MKFLINYNNWQKENESTMFNIKKYFSHKDITVDNLLNNIVNKKEWSDHEAVRYKVDHLKNGILILKFLKHNSILTLTKIDTYSLKLSIQSIENDEMVLDIKNKSYEEIINAIDDFMMNIPSDIYNKSELNAIKKLKDKKIFF